MGHTFQGFAEQPPFDSLPAIKHPIYIISKGRWKNPLTAKFLLAEKIPFKIAVEPQEYEQYCASIPRQFVAKLPFSNLGLGSYPARNWCWENAIANGHTHHWLFDDNIRNFQRLNKGLRRRCFAKFAITSAEQLNGRYSNVGILGFNYQYFVTRATRNPFVVNAHVYSAMLIRNDMPYRWRLKYNEDVDLCLNILHGGNLCSILLNAFVIGKVSTAAKMKGGNQTDLYKGNDPVMKFRKSKSLQVVWPQYVKVVHRFGRIHHSVSWQKHFKQKLILRTS